MSKFSNYLLLIILFGSLTIGQDIPFHKGVGFTGAFEVSSPQEIQFSKYTLKDFQNVKSLGCDAVRFYIFLDNMLADGNSELDPVFLYLLDQVVDMSEQAGLHLILTNMSGYNYANASYVQGRLTLLWTKMAEHFKDRGDKLHYEIANEPSNIEDANWNNIQQSVINAIRAIDTRHHIIVTSAMWGSQDHLQYLSIYNDDKIIYGFHFYDPFLYTHQGAEWAGMQSVQNIPFPYDASRMPSCPADQLGTLTEYRYNDYHLDGTIQKIQENIAVAGEFKNTNNVKVWCGEWGVLDTYTINDERALWYKTVREAFESYGIGWSIHEYTGSFGIFEKGSTKLFEYDLNIPMLEGLGLNVPQQSDYVLEQERDWLMIYGDYVAVNANTWSSAGDVELYCNENPQSGEFCIKWADVPLWSSIDIQFYSVKDFSWLAENGYVLDFWVKGDTPGTRFAIKFIDSQTSDPNDHKWPKAYEINESAVSWDNQWHHVQIPFRWFFETGTWDGQWYDPVGAFDWGAVKVFQIITDYEDQTGKKVWFDEIKITDPNSTGFEDNEIPTQFELKDNYPNPFNPSTTITYQIPEVDVQTTLKVFDLLGREVAVLVNERQHAGTYEVTFDASNLASGTYIYTLDVKAEGDNAQSYRVSKKMVLLK